MVMLDGDVSLLKLCVGRRGFVVGGAKWNVANGM